MAHVMSMNNFAYLVDLNKKAHIEAAVFRNNSHEKNSRFSRIYSNELWHIHDHDLLKRLYAPRENEQGVREGTYATLIDELSGMFHLRAFRTRNMAVVPFEKPEVLLFSDRFPDYMLTEFQQRNISHTVSLNNEHSELLLQYFVQR